MNSGSKRRFTICEDRRKRSHSRSQNNTYTPHQRLLPDPYHYSLLIAVNGEVNRYGYCFCAIPTPTTRLCDSTFLDGPVSTRSLVVPFISIVLQTNSF